MTPRIISIVCIMITCLFFLFVACDVIGGQQNQSSITVENDGITNESENGKYPAHDLYYSIKEDYPEYFYLWPTECKGIVIDEALQRYNVYGDISVKVSQEVYTSTTATIQAEIYLPLQGHQETVEIGIFENLGLEKYVDGVWMPVAFDGDSEYYFNVFVSEWRYWPIKNIPSEGKIITKEIKTEHLYEPLESGHYRVILFLDDVTCRYAEFDIE